MGLDRGKDQCQKGSYHPGALDGLPLWLKWRSRNRLYKVVSLKQSYSKLFPYEMTNEPPNFKPHCKYFLIDEDLANPH